MNYKKRINFREIAERVDTLIDMANDKSLIGDCRTDDLLNFVDKEMEAVTKALELLPDIDVHKDM